MKTLDVTMTRLVPRTVRAKLGVVGEAVDAFGGPVYLVTRAEALRIMRMQTGDAEGGRAESAWRNYELESHLRSAAGLVDENGNGKHGVVIKEWCPFNGVWCAWANCAPLDEMERTIVSCQNRGVTDYLQNRIRERELITPHVKEGS